MDHIIQTLPLTSEVRLPHTKGIEANPNISGLRTKEQKKPASQPDPGQPGGRDDPLRRGLNGAGCKRYLRYISQDHRVLSYISSSFYPNSFDLSILIC